MSPFLIISVILAYFVVLLGVSYLTSRNSDEDSFFTGNKKSPWYIVAYGMIGAALSGVTFVSLPGTVLSNGFHYGEFILGNIVGYIIITFVLVPLYYELKLVSIYAYLEKRFGEITYKTASFFFLLSQSLGAGLRLLLAVIVMETLLEGSGIEIPLWLLALIFIVLIYLYTYRAGIKTIVWTDMLQTTFLLLAVIFVVFIIFDKTGYSISRVFEMGKEKGYTQFFDWNYKSGNFFWTQFVSGILIAIAMMGLDQNMMQKSLTIKKVGDAQKNTLSFSFMVGGVQLFFLFFGVLLYLYSDRFQLTEMLPTNAEGNIQTDKTFPYLAVVNPQFGVFASLLFLLGISAAAFSSADSALTALTTSFCYDFLGLKRSQTKKVNTAEVDKSKWARLLESKKISNIRSSVHIGFCFLLFCIIIGFSFADGDIFGIIFQTAAYTYSPLLALFFLGVVTKLEINDKWTPYICILGPVLTYFLLEYFKSAYGLNLGFLPILISSTLICILLWVFGRSSKKNKERGA